MKKLLILVTFLGLTVHFCDVQSRQRSVNISQEEQTLLNRQLLEATNIACGNLESVRGLLKAGANVNAVDDNGKTALMFAATKGCREIVELLLQAGANVNAVGNDRWTVLMFAVLGGNREVVELLLNAKADINAVDIYGCPVLIGAATGGYREIVELLLQAGANVNAVGNSGQTALMGAATGDDRKIVELLLQAGANVNAVNNWGWMALMFAVDTGNREIVELLLQAGANVNAVDDNGKTVIDMAANQEIKDFLMRYKALTIIPIAKQFDQEPKPEDYIDEGVIPAGTSQQEAWNMLEQSDEKSDQQIKAFEQDLVDYWRNKVQEAYKLFLVNDLVPLRTLFTQEIYAKMALWPEIASFFNSQADFIYVLKQLQQGASEQERERLQAMINLKERIAKDITARGNPQYTPLNMSQNLVLREREMDARQHEAS